MKPFCNFYVDGDSDNEHHELSLCLLKDKLIYQEGERPHVRMIRRVCSFMYNDMLLACPDTDLWTARVDDPLIGFVNIPLSNKHQRANLAGVYGVTLGGRLLRNNRYLHNVEVNEELRFVSSVKFVHSDIKIAFNLPLYSYEEMWPLRNYVQAGEDIKYVNMHGKKHTVQAGTWLPRMKNGDVYISIPGSLVENEVVPVNEVRNVHYCSTGICLLSFDKSLYKYGKRTAYMCPRHDAYCHRDFVPLELQNNEELVGNEVKCKVCRSVCAYVHQNKQQMVYADSRCYCA